MAILRDFPYDNALFGLVIQWTLIVQSYSSFFVAWLAFQAKDYHIRDTHSRFVSMTIDMADISVERRVNPYDKFLGKDWELQAFNSSIS